MPDERQARFRATPPTPARAVSSGGEPPDERQEVVNRAIQRLRQKLLDLSNRNRLLNFRHSDRSRTHIRVIDELPDFLHQRLGGGDDLIFKALPPDELAPLDEKTDEFLMALEVARLTDQAYLEAIKTLKENDEQTSGEFLKIERALKDRVRRSRGLAPRASREVMSAGEYARTLGFEPSYDLPLPTSGTPPERHVDREVQTLLFPEQMERKLSGLRERTRQGLEEAGINTLFAAYGFMEWCEDENSDVRYQAPLLLQPLEIERRAFSGRYRYSIRGTSEETEINLTLSERLKRDFGLVLPALGERETPERYFAAVADLIKERPKWKVRRFVTIGIFSFGRLAMWHDLDPTRWTLEQNLLGNAVLLDLLGGSERREAFSADEYNVDDPEIAAKVPVVITDADSSQFSAIADAMDGRNLVVKGPPGTGKSQTITNLIAAALATGKTILFIADKMAALDVVKKRLDHAHLGDFCLELHSTKAKKKDLLDSLKRRLELQGQLEAPAGLKEAVEELERLKRDLTIYVDTLNQPYGRIGKTIQQILWAEQRTRDCLSQLPAGIDEIFNRKAKDLSKYDVERARSVLTQLEIAYTAACKDSGGVADHPWSFVQSSSLNLFDQEELLKNMERCHSAASGLKGAMDRLAAATGLRLKSIADARSFTGAFHRLLESLPRETNPLLLAELRPASVRDDLRTLLELWEKRSTLRNSLASRCADVDSLASRLEQVAEFASLVSESSASNSTAAELEALEGRMRNVCEELRAAAEEGRKVAGAFGATGPVKHKELCMLLAVVERIQKFPRELLRLRSPEVLDEGSSQELEMAGAQVRKFKQVLLELQKKFVIPDREQHAEIRQHARSLRDTFIVFRLGKRYRTAKALWLSLSREPRRVGRKVMATELEGLSEHLAETAAFLSTTRARNYCGRHFFGLETDFDALLEVARLGQEIRRLTAGLGALGVAVRQCVFEGTTDDVTALSSVVDAPARATLEGALSHLQEHGLEDLETCETTVRGRAEQLADLGRRVVALGLRGSFPLSAASDLAADAKELVGIEDKIAGFQAAANLLRKAGDRESSAPRIQQTIDFAERTVQSFDHPQSKFRPVVDFLLSSGVNENLAFLKETATTLEAFDTEASAAATAVCGTARILDRRTPAP